jgi:hypothetical protein
MEIPRFIQDIPIKNNMNQIKKYLKLNQLKSSTIQDKSNLEEYINNLTLYYQIPWRKDQQKIINYFLNNSEWNEIIVQAIFGGGKTTMIIAIIFDLILSKKINPKNIFVCAFNCAIKNELIKKLKLVGKCQIRTFDSLIYKLCKLLDYDKLKLLNFETKRKFVFENLKYLEKDCEIKYVFIDESQDLEKNCYVILKHYFQNAKFMFVGDIFQSIQKEPRDSLLWNLLNHSNDTRKKIFHMYDTPRVPPLILFELQKTLYKYYPEFQDTIKLWHSSSNNQKETIIKWKSFNTYKEVNDQILKKLEKWKPQETMILTFSSSITVRGSLGDVSRFRRFFLSKNISLNSDHKKMNDDRLFLTTANSSKGLERKNVIVILTFPLELAFSNFSDDLVMNLITVAISRTKKNIIFFVPNHIDRFCKILFNFKNCPKPLKEKLNDNKLNNKKIIQSNLEINTYESDTNNPITMLEMEHSITEILRQNVLSFETRELLISYTKIFNINDNFIDDSFNHIQTEEECSLLGLLFEGLILSYWTNKFPKFSFDEKKHHELFKEQLIKIKKLEKIYIDFINNNPITDEIIRLNGCHIYAKLHLLVHHKIFINFKDLDLVLERWIKIKNNFDHYKVNNQQYQLKTQSNISMPFVNGIIDACGIPIENKLPMIIYEIKASKAKDWKKLALLQSILYGILSAKDYFTIHLINVFSNKFISFNVSLKKNLMKLRLIILQDIISWNLNCFLSKNVKRENNLLLSIDYSSILFIDKDDDSICFCYLISPTKVRIEIIESNQMEEFEKLISIYKSSYNVKNIYSISHFNNYSSPFISIDSFDYLKTKYNSLKIDFSKCYYKLIITMIGLVCDSHIFNLKN